MQNFKSHFKFTKEQRNGIFLLVLLIIILQGIYFFGIPLSSNNDAQDAFVNKEKLARFNKEIDSLKLLEIELRKPRIYPFNPNYISDYKGASLGMSNLEIDRLHKFRAKDKWLNSAKEFQQITKISDSLLNIISPHFKFPEWVTNPKPKTKKIHYNNTPKTYAQKQDLNTATAKQLQTVNGIGVYYSERIVKYRNKFIGGFIADVQLFGVSGLTPEVIEKITKEFTVKTPRLVNKMDINKAEVEDLVTIQFIDYNLAHKIVEQRKLRDGFKTLDELTKVNDFPINKLDIIKLYLLIEKENK